MVAGLNAFKKGMTLLELIISMSLITVVMMTTSSLFNSFNKFYFDFVKSSENLGEISLAALEHMVHTITISNMGEVTTAPSIPVTTEGNIETGLLLRVDRTDPSSALDDTTYYYWKESTGGNSDALKYVTANPGGAVNILAKGIESIAFAMPTGHSVRINIGVKPQSGAAQEFETTVVMRGRSAQ
ncbi:MAG: prepilin-type N-terminal cleavage/methylation domain-containing protein [Candidatus Omnitrophota bacterium]